MGGHHNPRAAEADEKTAQRGAHRNENSTPQQRLPVDRRRRRQLRILPGEREEIIDQRDAGQYQRITRQRQIQRLGRGAGAHLVSTSAVILRDQRRRIADEADKKRHHHEGRHPATHRRGQFVLAHPRQKQAIDKQHRRVRGVRHDDRQGDVKDAAEFRLYGRGHGPDSVGAGNVLSNNCH